MPNHPNRGDAKRRDEARRAQRAADRQQRAKHEVGEDGYLMATVARSDFSNNKLQWLIDKFHDGEVRSVLFCFVHQEPDATGQDTGAGYHFETDYQRTQTIAMLKRAVAELEGLT